jgi:hypothetical protein
MERALAGFVEKKSLTFTWHFVSNTDTAKSSGEDALHCEGCRPKTEYDQKMKQIKKEYDAALRVVDSESEANGSFSTPRGRNQAQLLTPRTPRSADGILSQQTPQAKILPARRQAENRKVLICHTQTTLYIPPWRARAHTHTHTHTHIHTRRACILASTFTQRKRGGPAQQAPRNLYARLCSCHKRHPGGGGR